MADKLTEAIKRRINKIIIGEQFGISDELDLATEEIYAKIMKTLSKVPTVTNNELLQKECTISVDFFGSALKIRIIEHFFDSEEDYLKFLSNDAPIGGFRTLLLPISISLFCVGGNELLSDFRDTLGHELEHAYQEVKANKSPSKLYNDFLADRLFNYAPLKLNTPNEAEKNVARCIYLSDSREQSAFLFGLYQDFKSNPFRDVDAVIQNSEATVWLKNFYSSFAYVYKHRNGNDVKNALRFYFKRDANKAPKNSFPNVNQFLKFVSVNLKKYEWRYARTVYHCKEKFYIFNGIKYIAKHIDEQKKNLFILF